MIELIVALYGLIAVVQGAEPDLGQGRLFGAFLDQRRSFRGRVSEIGGQPTKLGEVADAVCLVGRHCVNQNPPAILLNAGLNPNRLSKVVGSIGVVRDQHTRGPGSPRDGSGRLLMSSSAKFTTLKPPDTLRLYAGVCPILAASM